MRLLPGARAEEDELEADEDAGMLGEFVPALQAASKRQAAADMTRLRFMGAS